MSTLDLPWSEKYRPSSLSEVIGQKAVVEKLASFVKRGNFPSMIFAGTAGIGKTSCALAMAHDLYGEDISSAFRELNASDTRGIDVIRGTVKEFAKTISLAKVPIKIIFLDEADALTADAQHALRRTMEKYSEVTRFILSANYASKIIEPIQSRCVVFRFKQLGELEMKEYIERIAKGENLQIDEKAVNALIYVGDGDLRKISNTLQSAAMQGGRISEAQIYEIASRARPKEIASMLRYAVTGDFENARKELDSLMLGHGMSAEDILSQCYKEVQGLNVDERAKLKIVVELGEANFRVVEGANERIQLEAMLAGIALIAKGK
ncbi:MAG: replication factor C small subunit [Candidatus Marsarchaeota archaeon]|jgi:replication factor C small subunit|nr:replication factor C small subunit [Candidatus Marsarchaeota archaeon]MCL5111834.1 replication factor C small subunit [Candidatus Marsarchaeota archaeon]